MANKRINELALRTPQTTDLMLIGDPTTGYSYKTTLLSALNLGVPTTRTITINGTTFDLSANRTWSVGTVTSVGLTMPSAFNVASSPVTGSGTIAVTAAGLASQYIRGDGTLADFPGGGGSGGASVSYYLNGSVNQGTLGGVTYYEMNKTPILGAGTNFTTSSNGYIASFLTDAGDPALLKIPGGNWNTEFYFAASSGGGTPTYYLELYKYDGTTFTLIASNSSNPDAITGGTSVEQYFTTLAVPETILTATDRLAIRIYVTTAGRTITLHTENSNLCQIITTFTTGLTALNGLTAQVQYFTTGSAGTDFNISSSTATHTFNIPTASATNRGLLSTADWTTFNNKVSSIIAGNAITISNASGNVTINHADTSGADPGATITGSNVFRSIVLDTYGHITGLSWSPFLISDLGGTAISSPSNGQVLSYNGTNWVNSSLSGLSIITGSGTTNWVPKFTSSSAIGLSNIYDGGSFIGVFTATDNLSGAKLQVSGAATFSSSVTAGGTIQSNDQNAFWLFQSGNPTDTKYWAIQNLASSGTFRIRAINDAITSGINAISITRSGISSVNLELGGNVGIGATPSAWTAFNPVLQVKTGSLAGSGTANFRMFANTYYDGSYKYIGTGTATQYEQDGYHAWYTAPSGSANAAITFTQRMTLNASGDLGIGLTSPVARLQVVGANGAGLRIDQGNYNYYGAFTHQWLNSGFTSTFMTLDNSGRLGIGTTSPAAPLQVAATGVGGYGTIGIRGTSAHVGFRTAADAFKGWVGYFDSATHGSDVNLNIVTGYNVSSNIVFKTNGDTGEAMRINSSNNVGIGTTSPGGTLDVAGALSSSRSFIRITNTDTNNYVTIGAGVPGISNAGMNFTVDATTRMIISSGGNVGIGTTSPSYRLDISGSSMTRGTLVIDNNGTDTSPTEYLRFERNSQGSTNYFNSIYSSTGSGTNLMQFRLSNTSGSQGTIMTLTGTGNVGIGTTSPSQLLDVRSANTSGATGATIRIGSQNHGNSGDEFANLEFYWGDPDAAEVKAKIYTKNVGNVGPGGGGAADLLFATTPAFGSSTERMRITSGGNVLIGNTAGNGYKLEVFGSTQAGNTFGQTFAGVGAYSQWITSGGAFAMGLDGAAGATERMRITSAGRVLIGTTTDNTIDLLQVAGSGRFKAGNGNQLYIDNAGERFTQLHWMNNGTAKGAIWADNTTSLFEIYGYSGIGLTFSTNATERMRITSGGEVYIAGTTDQGAYNLQVNGTGVWGAGAYVNGSDIRLKENISPIKTALEYVNKMNPISFKYKESYSKDQNIQPGFIAQELKELFKDEIWVNGIVSEGTDYLNVAYQNIIPLLTKAIQELKTELDTLKK